MIINTVTEQIKLIINQQHSGNYSRKILAKSQISQSNQIKNKTFNTYLRRLLIHTTNIQIITHHFQAIIFLYIVDELRQENSKFQEKINNEIIQLFQTISHQGEQLISQKDEDLIKDDKDPYINQIDETAQSHKNQLNNSQESSLLGFNYTFYNTTYLYSIIQNNRNILISKYVQNENICMIKFLQYLDNMENLINNVKLTTQNCDYKNQQILNQINSNSKEQEPQFQKIQKQQEFDLDQIPIPLSTPLKSPIYEFSDSDF